MVRRYVSLVVLCRWYLDATKPEDECARKVGSEMKESSNINEAFWKYWTVRIELRQHH